MAGLAVNTTLTGVFNVKIPRDPEIANVAGAI